MTTPAARGETVEAARRELGRCRDRLAALGPGRLVRPGPTHVGAEVVAGEPGPTPLERVRALLQELADDAADLAGEPRRAVPALGPHAAGDQLAVLAGDLLAAAGPDDDAVAARLHERLVALRRAL
ncbi:hypothetical protein [Pseudokineococcus lusitanus]|uniref:Uncharacterized protein n=1 Tax=Pseudokineococcus lusitanus TaxID=763993 RepID=A0A3N1HNI9_9ACTN|nr:hypothetical protein [Pseudokineococcus lusitanus]ROP44016.1 hypothetical protein EDC03_1613 [Pseudokineococcus lusitanus]